MNDTAKGRSGLSRRIARRRLHLGLTQTELGERLGVTAQSVQQWESGSTIPRAARIESIAKALEVSHGWLVGETEGVDGLEYVTTRSLPLLSWDQVAERRSSPDQPPRGDRALMVPAPHTSEASYALPVEQDVMTSPHAGSRSYPQGSVLIVEEREPESLPARVIAVHRESGAVTFRELVEDSGQRFLRPYSPQYPVLDAEEWDVVGTVTSCQLPE